MENILITGGAGFIGSYLFDELMNSSPSYKVTVLDNLNAESPGDRKWPNHLVDPVSRVLGDIRDRDLVERLVGKADAVIHLAALVGFGKSVYDIHDFVDVNVTGTAILLEAIAKNPVKKLIVASSIAVYGEGAYKDMKGKLYHSLTRSPSDLACKRWDVRNADGEKLMAVATSEEKGVAPNTIYGMTKYSQEVASLIACAAYKVPVTILRLSHVYGPISYFSNPYVELLASFSARLVAKRPPQILEDGEQLRDFVHVADVVKAFRLALEADESDGQVINIGSGIPHSFNTVAKILGEYLDGANPEPEYTGEFNMDDIRHCYPTIEKAQQLLNYQPQVALSQGLKAFARGLKNQTSK